MVMMAYFRERQARELPGKRFEWDSFYEFSSSQVVRQIDIFPDKVLLLAGGECCEASLEQMMFGPESALTSEEFHDLWKRLSKLPHGTSRFDSPYLKAAIRRLNY